MNLPGTEHDRDRRHWLRRLTLATPEGRPFLRRIGIDVRLFGLYLHRIDLPDPGLDLHDHPWPFVTLILRGGYEEEVADAREASRLAWNAEFAERFKGHDVFPRGMVRWWGSGTCHRMRMTEAHRITRAVPGTVTVVLRGRKTRRWGFYQPEGFVDHQAYDYVARRPLEEARRG